MLMNYTKSTLSSFGSRGLGWVEITLGFCLACARLMGFLLISSISLLTLRLRSQILLYHKKRPWDKLEAGPARITWLSITIARGVDSLTP